MSFKEPIDRAQVKKRIAEIAPLKAGFDLLQDHVVITDDNGIILYANKAVEENTGFSAQEVIGKNPGELWGGKMPKEFYERMWHTIKEEKQPFVGEVRNIGKDGKVYWQSLHISPVLDEQGEIKFFIGIEPTISDPKEKERFQGEFLSTLNRQYQDPFVVVQWTLKWLAERGKITMEQKAILEDLYKDEPGLSHLVKDLLYLVHDTKK